MKKSFTPILLIGCFIIAFFAIIKIRNSNHIEIKGGSCNETDKLLLQQLAKTLLEKRLFEREYYQINSMAGACNARMVNYNLKLNLLSITEDDIFSGISVQYSLKKDEIALIAKKKLSFADLRNEYMPNEKLIGIRRK